VTVVLLDEKPEGTLPLVDTPLGVTKEKITSRLRESLHSHLQKIEPKKRQTSTRPSQELLVLFQVESWELQNQPAILKSHFDIGLSVGVRFQEMGLDGKSVSSGNWKFDDSKEYIRGQFSMDDLNTVIDDITQAISQKLMERYP
jgi:hypothetical protein